MRRLTAAAGSDSGRERQNNEDRILVDPERGIFAVIDGVGGESGGEVAAQIALDTLRGRLSRRTTDAERLVREAIAQANRQIYEKARADPRLAGMACVLTVAVLDGEQVTIGHVGDSRLYLLRRGEIRKVTRDHAPVGAREDAGELSEAEAMRHPRRNEIFRDVGSAPHEPDDPDFIETHRLAFEPDSALLLCSDGLSDLVPSRDILGAVERHAGRPQAAVADLIAAANAAGGKDNVSVVLVEGERFAASVHPPSVTPIRGAASARSSTAERWRGALGSPGTLVLYALVAAALLAFAFREPLLRWAASLRGAAPTPGTAAATLQVGPGEGAFRTIGEALAAARPGQTVEVAPGDYSERLELKSGIGLVSATPRAAVLRPPPGNGAGPVVLGRNVRDMRLAGFRIAGAPAAQLAVGVRLVDSAAVLEELEITGATAAAIEIAGGAPSLRFTAIHGNPGAGIVLSDGASPRLVQNLVAENGSGPGGPHPGIDIGQGCRPVLIDNRILRNGGPQVRTASVEGAAEIFLWNDFGGLPRERAVQTVLPGAGPPGGALQEDRRGAAPGPGSQSPGRRR